MLNQILPESGSIRASHMPLHLWGSCAGRRLSPCNHGMAFAALRNGVRAASRARSEEHTSELQSRPHLASKFGRCPCRNIVDRPSFNFRVNSMRAFMRAAKYSFAAAVTAVAAIFLTGTRAAESVQIEGGVKSLMPHRMVPESGSLRASHMPLHLWGSCAGRRLNPCNHGMAFAAFRNGVRAASRAADSAILTRSTNEWTRTACT